ncbi:MAG: chemotaxis protein CheB [Chitinivibrionales bacterium]|nr:chemotaxis protein CheB [Chitinivibrionales bacterium]
MSFAILHFTMIHPHRRRLSMRHTECRNSDTRPIVVIGTSAGGIAALRDILAAFPVDLPAAVLVVQHRAPDRPEGLTEVLGVKSRLPVYTAQDHMPFQQGNVYVAPPDRHLMLDEGYLRLSGGPQVNLSRPAIDPLFLSAAVVYRSCVVGTVLSGMLDDGAVGLSAIKRCGGITIVQDPDDALYGDMPRNAIALYHPDFIVPLKAIVETIVQAVHMTKEAEQNVPEDLLRELDFLKAPAAIADFDALGELTPVTCPECGGPVRERTIDGQPRYRCHLGHAFSSKWLQQAQDRAVETSLWAAIRTLKERAHIVRRFAASEEQAGRARSAASMLQRAEESEAHAVRLQELLMGSLK